MKYLIKHTCDECGFTYKLLHDDKVRCGLPFKTPTAQKKHTEKNPEHTTYTMEVIDFLKD